MQNTPQRRLKGAPGGENIMRFKTILVGATAALIAMTGAAVADHGKVGLWQVATKVTMPGMPQTQVYTSQHCMTAGEVKMNAMPPSSNADCKMTNEKASGGSFSGDMVCTGHAKGSGHIAVTYDTDTHYAGQMTMTMNAGGQAMHMTNSFEGKWVSADCGKTAH
jgi:hypothetical protein